MISAIRPDPSENVVAAYSPLTFYVGPSVKKAIIRRQLRRNHTGGVYAIKHGERQPFHTVRRSLDVDRVRVLYDFAGFLFSLKKYRILFPECNERLFTRGSRSIHTRA